MTGEVQTEYYRKDEIIKMMNTRCSVRGCGSHYFWEKGGTGSLRGCDKLGLCKRCKTKINKGTTLTKKEFPVIPYQGRTTRISRRSC